LSKPLTGHRVIPWLIVASGALAVLASTGPLPSGLEFVFKPLTTLLLIAYAWSRGADAPRQRLLIRVGLVLSLAGDVFLLWPRQGFLPGLVAFLVAHLAYIAAFCVPLRLGAKPAGFALYGLVAVAMLFWLWPGIPAALRAPVIAYVVCLASMVAQAFGWWRRSAESSMRDQKLARFAAIGGLFFMASDSLLAINKFGTPVPASGLWILATYWIAQWCIASALSERAAAQVPTSP
jgi:uncharacterized membrane protein YhhN